MDPITATIIAIWAFNAGAGLMLVAKKLEVWNQQLDEINAAFDKMDLGWQMPELEELDKEHRETN